MTKLRLSPDQWLYALLLIASLIYFGQHKIWLKRPVIDWDISLYYAYLPGVFIYGDLRFENPPPELQERHFFLNQNEDGQRYLKMTSGLAMLYSPFFLLAHAFASLSESYPANGFSAPYRMMLLLGTLFYTFVGLHLLRLLLRKFFGPWPTGLTLVVLFWGSNLAYYSFVEPMSHAYNFFLVAVLLWIYFRYRQSPRLHWALLFGLATGLLVLIRPVDILILLFPLLHFWRVPFSVGPKVGVHLLLAAAAGFLVLLPQFFYWHYSTGTWLLYSYNEEGFFWLEPKIWEGLFSYRKGWFVYSPLLLLALPGLLRLAQKKHTLFWPLSLSLLAVLWVTFSWWCWWYGGGFGARPLIDFLPLVAFALAAALQWLWNQKIWARSIALVLVILGCHFSLSLQKQYYWGLIHWDAMSKDLYWKQVYRWEPAENFQQLLDPPDYEAALKGER